MRQKIELIEQELGRWRTGEAVPPSEQTALGEELPLCDQVRQATKLHRHMTIYMYAAIQHRSHAECDGGACKAM